MSFSSHSIALLVILTATTVNAFPSSFKSTKHVVTLTNANMGTIMGKRLLTTDGLATKCVITETSGTKDGANYVIGTPYTFTVNTDEGSGLGMVTSVGEGTPAETWEQFVTGGRETSKVVTFTPTTAGDMSVHALCGGSGATPLYLATPLTGTIVPAPFVATCSEITDGGGAFASCTGSRVYDSTKAAATSPSDANCCKEPEDVSAGVCKTASDCTWRELRCEALLLVSRNLFFFAAH